MIFSRWGLKYKFLAVVAMASVVCALVALAVAHHYNEKEFSSGLVKKGQTVHSRLEAATIFVAKQGGLQPLLERLRQKYRSSDELSSEEKENVLKQVPIYAAMQVGSYEADKEHYRFRIFSDEPRNEKNKATSAELPIFEKFKADAKLEEWVENDGKVVTVFRPVRLHESQGCLVCHGAPSQSPWGNGKDILGYQMENWTEGKLHGVFAVASSVEAVKKAEADAGTTSNLVGLALFISLGALGSLLLAGIVIRAPISQLSGASDSLRRVGSEVGSAAQQVSGSAARLSQSVTEEAAALEETAASLEELASMVKQNSENAERTAKSSEESKIKAAQGEQEVARMVEAMQEIKASNGAIGRRIDRTNEELESVVKVIQEIGQKTKVINDIVFQTKLLSFNASVEAARAGENGKGFAVVAEEVGNLAHMSGAASKEISQLLEESVKKVALLAESTKLEMSQLVRESTEKVNHGEGVALNCGEVLRQLVQEASDVANRSQEISAASSEQSKGIQQVTKAMSQLEEVTHRNTQASAEAAKVSDQLRKEAEELSMAVAGLNRTVVGAKESGGGGELIPILGRTENGDAKERKAA